MEERRLVSEGQCAELVELVGRIVKIGPELGQLDKPVLPLLLGGVKVVFHMAEEFYLHNVNLVDGDARYFGPGLIGVGVVIQNYANCQFSLGKECIGKTYICFRA